MTLSLAACALVAAALQAQPEPAAASGSPPADASSAAPAAAAPPSAADEAARAESAAFSAVDAQRWCDAVREFMRAHAFAPADELVFNAGLAAEKAGDADRARALFARVPPASSRGKAAAKHLAELAGVATTATCPDAPASAGSGAGAASGSGSEGAQGAETGIAPPPDDGGGVGVLPLGLLGAGVIVAVAGGIGIAAGSAQFVAHEDAVAAIRAGEKAGADPEDLADEHERQRASRAAWEAWGLPAVIGGAVAIVVGAAAIAAGAALFATE